MKEIWKDIDGYLEKQLDLHYKVTFEYKPQFKQDKYALFNKLNTINIDSERLLEYNYHTRYVKVLCTKCNNVYIKRVDHYLKYANEKQCPTCVNRCVGSQNWKDKISETTKLAMKRPEILEKINKENSSIKHKERFLKVRHKGSTNLPTSTEQLIMDFMIKNNYAWNKTFNTRDYRMTFPNKIIAGYYKFDFINTEKFIIIECDGRSHSNTKQKIIDEKREQVMSWYGYKTYRFSNNYIKNNLNEFKKFILTLKVGDANDKH